MEIFPPEQEEERESLHRCPFCKKEIELDPKLTRRLDRSDRGTFFVLTFTECPRCRAPVLLKRESIAEYNVWHRFKLVLEGLCAHKKTGNEPP